MDSNPSSIELIINPLFFHSWNATYVISVEMTAVFAFYDL